MTDRQKRAKQMRHLILGMIVKAQAGHLGSSFSCVEILLALNEIMTQDDDLILSKGHGSEALYALLVMQGILEKSDVMSMCQPGSLVGLHCDNRVPGISVTTGSLGNGLGMAIGKALARKRDGRKGSVYVVCGDLEIYEGIVSEAVRVGADLQLANLTVVVDSNQVGILKMSTYRDDMAWIDSWQHLGIALGHNIEDIATKLRVPKGKRPSFCYARTVKGYPVSDLEGAKRHSDVPTEQQAIAMHKKIEEEK